MDLNLKTPTTIHLKCHTGLWEGDDTGEKHYLVAYVTYVSVLILCVIFSAPTADPK